MFFIMLVTRHAINLTSPLIKQTWSLTVYTSLLAAHVTFFFLVVHRAVALLQPM